MNPGRLLYALFMFLGLLTAVLLRRPSPLPPRRRLGILAGAVVGGSLGSKLPFVILGGDLFGPAWLGDGKTILAGLAGGYLGVEVAKLLLGIREKTGDGFAVPLAAGIAVGRWGCFFNGCCSAPGHPIPIYESGFHAAMAVLLWRLEGVEALRFQLLKLYLIAYCAFRFLIEFVRVEPRIALGLTAYQYGAAVLSAALLVLWWQDAKLKHAIRSRDPGAPPAPAGASDLKIGDCP